MNLFLIENLFIDLDSGNIGKSSQEIIEAKQKATPKQVELISLLIERFPEYTSRYEIQESLWRGGNISVESITQLVNRTRNLLSDKDKKILINNHGLGYKFSNVVKIESLQELDSYILDDTVNTVRNEVSQSSNPLNWDIAEVLHYLYNNNARFLKFSALWLSFFILVFQLVNVCYNSYLSWAFDEQIRNLPIETKYVTVDDDKTVVKLGDAECYNEKGTNLFICR
ncbi:transcriptional regulator [Vibrio cholerae]